MWIRREYIPQYARLEFDLSCARGQILDSGQEISQMSKAQIGRTLRRSIFCPSRILYILNEVAENKKNEIIRWLSPTDPTTNQAAARKKHEDQTGKWFTKGEEYSKWKENSNSFLWLHGIAGCGKTILWLDLYL